MERIKYEECRAKMLQIYSVEESAKGSFLLQVDWILESAVYPFENDYVDNLMDLWNIYMPGYEFNRIVLEYSKKYFSVLRYIHDKEIFKFISVKHMQECAIKNYVKFCISQGQTNRMVLVRECFDLLKDISDRTKLYDAINRAIEHYFPEGEIQKESVLFLKRFQDYTEQPYVEIVERLTDIQEQKEMVLSARTNLLKDFNVSESKKAEIQTLISIVLCRLAMADGERKFSEILELEWNNIMKEIDYTDRVYSFIEKFEKPYMNAACYGIRNIKDKKVIMQLYKDAVILCAVLQAIESGHRYGMKEINEFWKCDGMHFAKGYFFDDEYERMKGGFDKQVLLLYKEDIRSFHDALIGKINETDFSMHNANHSNRGARTVTSEMNHIALNEKERQIGDLQERISDLEEKLDNSEKEVLSKFIALLDSKKYDYVLGKLYRMAYSKDIVRVEDIQRILKNLFEIMNISGIDIYGELGEKVSVDEIKRGKYRVSTGIIGVAEVKYPGYKVGNSTILHPVAEEV